MTALGDAVPAGDDLRLLIADDQPLIRRGLSLMLAAEPGIDVVGQAADGQEAIDRAVQLQPDVVVMDLQMPRVSGVVATREITARLPGTRVVVLTTFDDDELVFEAIRAGAHAYLLKDATEDQVLDTIRAAHRGEPRLSPSIARKVMDRLRQLPRNDAASATEAAAPLPPSAATAPPLRPRTTRRLGRGLSGPPGRGPRAPRRHERSDLHGLPQAGRIRPPTRRRQGT
ncbi:MAG TPA: response regulator transcription factor, partial [Burkholderiaceae bacterium]|nr:response regulator transcription factor [Burkholderiaceae bacterium]